jgi:monoamine oxidase
VASYTWGGDADRFDGMSEEDIIGRCLTDISIIHNRDLKFIKKIFRKGIVKSWANDPHTIGAFAYLAPYQVMINLEH